MQTGWVAGERKSFLSMEGYQLEELYEPPEKVSLKLTAPNQTLKPFLGMADQDPSFQILNIQKEYVRKDPNNATAGCSKKTQFFTISTYSRAFLLVRDCSSFIYFGLFPTVLFIRKMSVILYRLSGLIYVCQTKISFLVGKIQSLYKLQKLTQSCPMIVQFRWTPCILKMVKTNDM